MRFRLSLGLLISWPLGTCTNSLADGLVWIQGNLSYLWGWRRNRCYKQPLCTLGEIGKLCSAPSRLCGHMMVSLTPGSTLLATGYSSEMPRRSMAYCALADRCIQVFAKHLHIHTGQIGICQDVMITFKISLGESYKNVYPAGVLALCCMPHLSVTRRMICNKLRIRCCCQGLLERQRISPCPLKDRKQVPNHPRLTLNCNCHGIQLQKSRRRSRARCRKGRRWS
jgi:hypothetical protein